jgi:hypothetical protein
MNQSKLFSLNWNDVLKGLLMAVITPAIFLVQQAIENGGWVFDWKKIAMAGIAGGVAYIIKNFFTKPASESDSPLAK